MNETDAENKEEKFVWAEFKYLTCLALCLKYFEWFNIVRFI